MSDDSSAFSPTMYNRVLVKVRLVPFSFTGVPFVDRLFNLYFMFVFLMLSSDMNVKNTWPLPRTVGLVAIGYSITCVYQCWRVWQLLQMYFTLTTHDGICVR